MNLDEIKDYLMEHNDFSEVTATNYAIELIGKSMEEVDGYLNVVIQEEPVIQPCNTTVIQEEPVIQEKEIDSTLDVIQLPEERSVLGQEKPPRSYREPTKTTLPIRLEIVLKDKIKQQAEELGMTVSALVRDILKQYFK